MLSNQASKWQTVNISTNQNFTSVDYTTEYYLL